MGYCTHSHLLTHSLTRQHSLCAACRHTGSPTFAATSWCCTTQSCVSCSASNQCPSSAAAAAVVVLTAAVAAAARGVLPRWRLVCGTQRQQQQWAAARATAWEGGRRLRLGCRAQRRAARQRDRLGMIKGHQRGGGTVQGTIPSPLCEKRAEPGRLQDASRVTARARAKAS